MIRGRLGSRKAFQEGTVTEPEMRNLAEILEKIYGALLEIRDEQRASRLPFPVPVSPQIPVEPGTCAVCGIKFPSNYVCMRTDCPGVTHW